MLMAQRRIFLCDKDKIGRTSFARFATIGEIDVLVTNDIHDAEVRKLQENGVEVLATSLE